MNYIQSWIEKKREKDEEKNKNKINE